MKNLYKALAAFQQECPELHKSSDVVFNGKKQYSFISFDELVKKVRPVLQKSGLMFFHTFNNYNIVCHLVHLESGEEIQSSATMVMTKLQTMNEFQSAGSGITYYKRYTLFGVLGVVTDEDNDAVGESGKRIPTKDQIEKTKDKLKKKQVTLKVVKEAFDISGTDIEEWYNNYLDGNV